MDYIKLREEGVTVRWYIPALKKYERYYVYTIPLLKFYSATILFQLRSSLTSSRRVRK